MLMFRVADARETGMIGINDGLVVQRDRAVHGDASREAVSRRERLQIRHKRRS
jgi:hypothetical protein